MADWILCYQNEEGEFHSYSGTFSQIWDILKNENIHIKEHQLAWGEDMKMQDVINHAAIDKLDLSRDDDAETLARLRSLCPGNKNSNDKEENDGKNTEESAGS